MSTKDLSAKKSDFLVACGITAGKSDQGTQGKQEDEDRRKVIFFQTIYLKHDRQMYYFGLLRLVNVMLNVFSGKVKDSTYLSNFAGILR